MIYDLIIIGGGPAGAGAAVYAARKKLQTLFITAEWGGQSVVSEQIYNWIGTTSLSGNELAENFKNHVLANTGEGQTLEVKESEKVIKIVPKALSIDSALGTIYEITTESGQDVAVVGGGNAGFETAAQLLAYCKSVTLLHRSESFDKADEITVDKVLKNPKMKAVKNVEILEIQGDKFVEGIVYKDRATSQETELKVSGIFVEIGQIPNTNFVKDLVPLDEIGRIKINPLNQKTLVPGIWAAGDCTDVLYHQNNIAAGDAVRALEDIYLAIHTK